MRMIKNSYQRVSQRPGIESINKSIELIGFVNKEPYEEWQYESNQKDVITELFRLSNEQEKSWMTNMG